MKKAVVIVIILFTWSHICVRAGYELGVTDALKGRFQ